MKIANLIDITPEEIAQLEKVGYIGMNINLATGRIDLIKAEEKEEDYEEENCCNCGYGNCCECECDYDENEEEEYTIEDVVAEGLRAIGIIR